MTRAPTRAWTARISCKDLSTKVEPFAYLLIVKPTGFNEVQKQALLDLLVVGMYADHHLASAEDDCIQQRLARFQFASDYECRRVADASFARASRHANSPEAIREYVTQLASHFTTPNLKRSVYDTLEELLTSDGRVTSEESQLLTALWEAFGFAGPARGGTDTAQKESRA